MGNLGHGFGESSGHRDGSMEESTVTEGSGGGCGRKRRDLSSEDESSKIVSTTINTNDLIESNSNRMKISGSKSERGDSKAEAEASSAAGNKSKDYIHVRARRGQATDSHSLAERVRREKISERMKILQDLVPGCNKVIGKAFVLDEIINYIQCLRRQVEFLSMKLVAVNSGMNLNPSLEGFHSKDMESNSNRMKISGSKNERGDSKAEAEASSAAGNKSKDYIHVRARRGQATDSHSLAERVRREKISERMKILQDLVPGCNKVIGKAIALDETINYIQSLGRQVEFLSMKLEAVCSAANLNPSLVEFHSKDLGAPPFDACCMIFGSQAAGIYSWIKTRVAAFAGWWRFRWSNKVLDETIVGIVGLSSK